MVRGKKQKPSGLNSVTRACNVAYYCESLGFIFKCLGVFHPGFTHLASDPYCNYLFGSCMDDT